MKKISVMLTALASALAFTACDESKDDHPTINTHEGEKEAIFLNTPEMANMAVQITEDNNTKGLHMTCSQPDYGFAASVKYEVEVSLTDFTTPIEEGCPASVVLATSFVDCSEINPVLSEIAEAMCQMLNIESDSQVPTAYYPLYLRLIANVQTADQQNFDNTTYVSNIVKMNAVSCGYLAIIVPGLPTGIYCRGGMNDWGADEAWEFVTTSESGVYEIADCTIAAGTEFKIADSGWASINCGTNGSNPKFNEPYVLNNDSGSGNMTMESTFSGRIQLTVKSGTYTMLLEADEPDTPGQATGVYIRGSINDWGTPAEDEFLTTDIKNVWQIADVTLPAGSEWKIADANWGTYNLGLWNEVLIGEPFELTTGGGNIAMSESFTGSVTLKIKSGKFWCTLTPAGE
ncbi:MAG: SusE domain-containing protein [Bacteroidales bacterium]|nr:SusE domain-containing protein [Bacteroidales bacterium]